ncbi:MAG: hypothetical protein AB2L14_15670 [Candidatus Xenobiia bacterium LiM19]
MKGFTVKALIILILLFNISICTLDAQNLTQPFAHEPLTLLSMNVPEPDTEQQSSESSSASPVTLAHEAMTFSDIEPVSTSSADTSTSADRSTSTPLTHESPTLIALDNLQPSDEAAQAAAEEASAPLAHEPSSIYMEYEPSYEISADSPQVKKSDGKDAPKKTPVKVSIGNWNEWDRLPNRKGDYAFNYIGVVAGKFHIRYDYFNLDRSRYWVNYGQIALVKSSWLNFNYAPGVMWINGMFSGKRKELWYFGGHFTLSLPKLGLTVLHKGYGSSEGPFNQTFADLRICKFLDISGYNFSTLSANPDTYVGPKVKIPVGAVQFHIWYGFSTNPSRPEAKMLNCATHITF